MFGKLTLEVFGGADIECAIQEAIAIALLTRHPVEFQFNGITVAADEGSNAALLLRDWNRATAGYIEKRVGPHPKPVLSKKEKENDARIQAESDRDRESRQEAYAAQEKERRGRVDDRLKGASDIEIAEGQEKAWQQITAINGGSGIYHYAVRWARLMQVEIAAGKLVSDIQQPASQDADFEGMSGATYRVALNALKDCWKYGDQLS